MISGRKIKIVNFKTLDPQKIHPYYSMDKKTIVKEMVLCSPSGEIYVNKKFRPSAKYLAEVFETLMQETSETLREYESQMKQEFQDVCSFEDWEKMEGSDVEKNRAFAMLMVPIELRRRQIEKQYYNS